MTEEWRDITGHAGYQVSSMGRVRNLGGRRVRAGDRGGMRVTPARVLRPFLAGATGYMQVLLPDRRKHSVHRLVAAAFCGVPAPGLVVDHINSVRSDNRAENLRWITHSDNICRPYRESGLRGWSAGRLGSEAPKHTPVVGRHRASGEERRFASAMDAVREFGFDSGCISKCCHGRQSSHLGWEFRFADGAGGYPQKGSRTSLGREWPDEVAA